MPVFNNQTPSLSSKILTAITIVIFGSSLLPEIGFAVSESADQSHELSTLESWDSARSNAKAKDIPIVLLVEQRHCGFCQRAKAERLRPASLSDEYAGRAIFVSVATDLEEPPIEYNGAKISTFEFAESFDASLTPTVVFLDFLGNEVQERMVGYSADETEAAIFETRLAAAIDVALRRKQRR